MSATITNRWGVSSYVASRQSNSNTIAVMRSIVCALIKLVWFTMKTRRMQNWWFGILPGLQMDPSQNAPWGDWSHIVFTEVSTQVAILKVEFERVNGFKRKISFWQGNESATYCLSSDLVAIGIGTCRKCSPVSCEGPRRPLSRLTILWKTSTTGTIAWRSGWSTLGWRWKSLDSYVSVYSF